MQYVQCGEAPRGVWKEMCSPVRNRVSRGRWYPRGWQWDNDRGNTKQRNYREGTCSCNVCKCSVCFYASPGPLLCDNLVLGQDGELWQALPNFSRSQLIRLFLPAQLTQMCVLLQVFSCLGLWGTYPFSPLFPSTASPSSAWFKLGTQT